MANTRQEAQLITAEFFDNTGGLETSNSPFLSHPDCASGGFNFDYVQRGAIRKRKGHALLNSGDGSPTYGLGFFNDSKSNRAIVRFKQGQAQLVSSGDWSYSNISHELPGSTVEAVDRVVSNMFTGNGEALWFANRTRKLGGVYKTDTGFTITDNGVTNMATGSLTAALNTTASTFVAAGTFRYVATAVKHTGSEGNAALEVAFNVTDPAKGVLLTLTNNLSPSVYKKVNIYRSAINGAEGFTVGDLVAELTTITPTMTFIDTGTSIVETQPVPRAYSVVADYSELPDGVYKGVHQFKRRLVTFSGSTLYLSEEGNAEAWPQTNRITLPTGGNITCVIPISFTTQYSSAADEHLCIFKQNELWVLTGSDYTDWEVKYIDDSGVSNQSLATQCNGFISWVNYRGAFLWNGSDKPTYISQNIENLFQRGGTIKKDSFSESFVTFYKSRNEVQFYLQDNYTVTSHSYTLKLDLRLTQLGTESTLIDRKLDGIFTPDLVPIRMTAGIVYIPDADAPEEVMLLGDENGALYHAYSALTDANTPISLNYLTQNLDMGSRGTNKRFHKVVVWVKKVSGIQVGLEWWVNYRDLSSTPGSITQTAPVTSSNSLIWDSGNWDEKVWDNTTLDMLPITFNLFANNDGDCIQLRLSESSNKELVIYGYTIHYSQGTLRK